MQLHFQAPAMAAVLAAFFALSTAAPAPQGSLQPDLKPFVRFAICPVCRVCC